MAEEQHDGEEPTVRISDRRAFSADGTRRHSESSPTESSRTESSRTESSRTESSRTDSSSAASDSDNASTPVEAPPAPNEASSTSATDGDGAPRTSETSAADDGPDSTEVDDDDDDGDFTSDPVSIDFVAFMQSLYLSALMAMGQVENPETRLLTTNLDIARQDIDILVMLREKTRGNLTHDEDSFLKQIIAHLQMLFVKKAG